MVKRGGAVGAVVLGLLATGLTAWPATAATTAGDYSLTVTVRATEEAAPVRHTLRCRPTGGSHPQAAAACRDLLAARPRPPFAPVPGTTACTQIYGGPQTARVVGRWAGQQVRATFNRINGCELDRWEQMGAVLSALTRT